MLEPAVTLTNFALAAFCLGLGLGLPLWRGHGPGQGRNWAAGLFFGAALSALLGGLVHGFFPDEDSLAYGLLWRSTLLAIGATGLCAFKSASGLAGGVFWRRWENPLLALLYTAYAVVAIGVSQDFKVAIAGYTPAMVALALVAFRRWMAARTRPYGLLAGGVGLSFVAALVQMARLGLHPVWFNHNALYHLVQAAAMYLLYRGFKGVWP